MKNYYYAIEKQSDDPEDTYVIITAVQFFEETGLVSDQGSEVFTDKHCRDFNDDDDLWWKSISDPDFPAFFDEVSEKFAADQVCESMWQADDLDGFLKYLEDRPNFSTCAEFSALNEEN